MVLAHNHATSEGPIDEVGERLLRPLGLKERIRVTCELHEVPVDALFPSARGLGPSCLRLLATGYVVLVPLVVQVSSRDAAEKEHVIWFGRQCQAEPQNLSARKETHRQVFLDKVQAVTLGAFDWDHDEA